MIKGLKIKNWKSHLDSEFEFGKGTNVLVGVMGSGKSSVLSAISFALFGTFPSHRSREVTLDDTIMERPHKKESAEISLFFSVDGEEFEVSRTVERGKGTTEASIRKNGEIIDTGPSRVTEIVGETLKVDYSLFSRAVYSEQDGLDNFLEIRKGERMKKIDNLLQIDRFEKCRGNITTLINRLGDRIDSRKSVLEDMEDQENFGRIEKIEEDIEKLDCLIEDLKENAGSVNKQYRKLKEEIKEVKDASGQIKKLQNKKSVLQGVISNLKEEIQSKRPKEDISKDKTEKELKNAEKELKNLKNSKKDLKEDLDDFKEDKRDRKVRIRNLQRRIQKVKGIHGECPTCERDLEEKQRKRLIQERRKKISKLGKEKEGLEKGIECLEEKIGKIDEKEEELEEKKKELKKQRDIIEDIKTKEKKIEEKRGKLEKIKKELEDKRKKYDFEGLEEKQEEINNLSGKREKMKERIQSKNEILEERKREKENLGRRKKRYEKLKDGIERSEKTVRSLKKFRSALKSTQDELRSRFIEDVNKTLTKVWKRLYPYNDFTDLRFTVNDGDYELQFKNKQGWQPVEGVASGGERTSACLALRIAFSLVLAPNLGWLVLDEPTHNLDKKTVEELSELLRTGISDFVEQIFLITPDETMENAANSYLYNLNRNKERDIPTEVEEIR